MSVGDIKGSRRRQKILQIRGHAPRPKKRSVAEALARERALTARLNKISQGKK